MPPARSKVTGAQHRWQIGHILRPGAPLSPLSHDCGVWSRCVVSIQLPSPGLFTCKPWPAAVALGVCCSLRAHLRDNEDRQPATDHLLRSCQVPVSESSFSTHPHPSTPLPDQMEVQHTLLCIIPITALLGWLTARYVVYCLINVLFYIGFGKYWIFKCACPFPLFFM